MKKHLLILSLIVGLTGNIASADELYRFGQDYRAMAMGNTGIVTGNNSFVLFQNPAALSNVFDWWFDTPSLQITGSEDLKQDAQQATSEGEAFFDNLVNNMDDFTGREYYLRAAVGVNLVSNISPKGGAIAGNYLAEHTIHAQIRNAAAPEFDFFQRNDTIRIAGFSYPVGIGKLVIGLSYKQIDRSEFEFTYTTLDAANKEPIPDIVIPAVSDEGVSGSGSGYDLGFVYRTSTAAHIALAGVFRSEVDLGDAGTIPANMDVGIGLRQEAGMFRFVAEMDIRDVTRALGREDVETSEKSIMRRVHYGAELGLFPLNKTYSLISLRAGYNSGYLSWGGEFRPPVGVTLGAARYSEEIGEYAGQRESMRTEVYASFDLMTLISLLFPV